MLYRTSPATPRVQPSPLLGPKPPATPPTAPAPAAPTPAPAASPLVTGRNLALRAQMEEANQQLAESWRDLQGKPSAPLLEWQEPFRPAPAQPEPRTAPPPPASPFQPIARPNAAWAAARVRAGTAAEAPVPQGPSVLFREAAAPMRSSFGDLDARPQPGPTPAATPLPPAASNLLDNVQHAAQQALSKLSQSFQQTLEQSQFLSSVQGRLPVPDTVRAQPKPPPVPVRPLAPQPPPAPAPSTPVPERGNVHFQAIQQRDGFQPSQARARQMPQNVQNANPAPPKPRVIDILSNPQEVLNESEAASPLGPPETPVTRAGHAQAPNIATEGKLDRDARPQYDLWTCEDCGCNFQGPTCPECRWRAPR